MVNKTNGNGKTKAKIRLNPAIKLEKHLSKQIYEALQGSIVEAVLRKIKTSSSDAYWRSSMEGHSLKVQQDLLPVRERKHSSIVRCCGYGKRFAYCRSRYIPAGFRVLQTAL